MAETLRTYIYYSDEKIHKLAQELPPPGRARRGLRRVRGGGIKVAGTGPDVSIGPPEPEPILRTMHRVWRHLDAEGQIGTFEEPRAYFYGHLPFLYGLFDTVNPPVLFLVGTTGQTIVALGGSKKHVRGHRDSEIAAAENAQDVVMEPDVAAVIHASLETSVGEESTGTPPAAQSDDSWALHVAGIHWNWQQRRSRQVEFEVLARQEDRARVSPPFLDSPRDVLIGSPLFVAQA